MSDRYDVIKTIRLSEKATRLSEEENSYVFIVHREARKKEIGDAVEKLFSTKVQSVRTINVRGKKKRRGNIVGRTKNIKKAVVRLAEGEKLDII